MAFTRRAALIAGSAVLAARGKAFADAPTYDAFGPPQDVVIAGYDNHAMEPFVTRDGKLLLFNNRNDPANKTDLHWAERVDDLHFTYRGPIAGANTPDALEGVPSLSARGELVFVSTRSYGQTFSTIYHTAFANGAVTEPPKLIDGISRKTPGWVNFDAEISADGATLYYVDSWFGTAGFPQSADLMIAQRGTPHPDSARIFQNINSSALEYAAGISANELELFFTRVAKIAPDAQPSIWRAVRASTADPFGPPQRIAAVGGFAEAPSPSPDGKALYFHALIDGKFRIRRVAR